MTTGGWLNGVVLSEVLSNQSDPHGLGAYQLHVTYDPVIFRQPTFNDGGVLDDGGVRGVTCGVTTTRPGEATFDCFSTGAFGVGASWLGPRVVARVTLTLDAGVYSLLGSANATVNATVFASAAVTNTCGQPLNDGSIQPIAGQNECQGNLLPGLAPGGALADVNPSALTVVRGADPPLVGDLNGDCMVNALDLSLVSKRFLVAVGSVLYAPAYDLNGDGVINALDIHLVATHFGNHC